MSAATTKPPGRFALLGWAFLFIFVAAQSLVLFTVQVYMTALLWIGLIVPIFFVVTGLVRRFTNWHRRWAGKLLGEPIPEPYLVNSAPTRLAQLRGRLKDPATWRDLLW